MAVLLQKFPVPTVFPTVAYPQPWYCQEIGIHFYVLPQNLSQFSWYYYGNTTVTAITSLFSFNMYFGLTWSLVTLSSWVLLLMTKQTATKKNPFTARKQIGLECLERWDRYEYNRQVMLFAAQTQCIRMAVAVATWLCGCLCIYHSDVLCPNDWVDHHATFMRL